MRNTLRSPLDISPKGIAALALLGIIALCGCSSGEASVETRQSGCVITEISPNTGVGSTSEAVNLLLNQLPGDQSDAQESIIAAFGPRSDGTAFKACLVDGSPDEMAISMFNAGSGTGSGLTVTVDSGGHYTNLTRD